MAEVEHVTLVSEHRHELGAADETSLHQVRMDVPRDALPVDAGRGRVDCATGSSGWPSSWARGCIDTRHAEVIELVPADESGRRAAYPQRAGS